MSSSNLTPIRIPGKNTRVQRRSVTAANRNKRSRPPGRPTKVVVLNETATPTPSSASSGTLPRHRSLKHLKPRRKMAALEKLPVEILTPIFLLSMNLDLPRASPIIAGKLSSRLTIVNAIVNAFSPTWEYYYELIKSARTTRSNVMGDANLQSAMLRCRCATLLNMMHAQDVWLSGRVVERESGLLASSYNLIEHRSRRNHNQILNNDSFFIGEYKSRWRSKITDDWFHQDYADFIQISSATELTHTSFFSTQWKWTGFLLMHTDLEIPESLLQGPWTEEMLEYLFWLIRADARVHWKQSTSGEVALLGLKTAIRTGNLHIIFIFQYLGLGHTITLDLMKWALRNAGGDKIEVILRVMSMFLYGSDGNNHDSDLIQLQLASELNLLRFNAQRQEEGSIENLEALALVNALDDHFATFTIRANIKAVMNGLTKVSDEIV